MVGMVGRVVENTQVGEMDVVMRRCDGGARLIGQDRRDLSVTDNRR